jgi:hypothetical protein
VAIETNDVKRLTRKERVKIGILVKRNAIRVNKG